VISEDSKFSCKIEGQEDHGRERQGRMARRETGSTVPIVSKNLASLIIGSVSSSGKFEDGDEEVGDGEGSDKSQCSVVIIMSSWALLPDLCKCDDYERNGKNNHKQCPIRNNVVLDGVVDQSRIGWKESVRWLNQEGQQATRRKDENDCDPVDDVVNAKPIGPLFSKDI